MTPRIGDTLPDLVRTIELADMVAYGAATWDWNRLHYDLEYAQANKLPAPLVDGQAFGAYLAEQLLDTFGPGSWVHKLGFRFRSMVFAGETIRVAGTVTNVDARVVSVEQEITVEDRVCVTATAQVTLP